MDQYVKQINRIIYTLNLVTVRGKDNLDCLLGSIQALEQVKNAMETEVLEEKKHAAENK